MKKTLFSPGRGIFSQVLRRRGDKKHKFKIVKVNLSPDSSAPLPPLALRQGDDAGAEGKACSP